MRIWQCDKCGNQLPSTELTRVDNYGRAPLGWGIVEKNNDDGRVGEVLDYCSRECGLVLAAAAMQEDQARLEARVAADTAERARKAAERKAARGRDGEASPVRAGTQADPRCPAGIRGMGRETLPEVR